MLRSRTRRDRISTPTYLTPDMGPITLNMLRSKTLTTFRTATPKGSNRAGSVLMNCGNFSAFLTISRLESSLPCTIGFRRINRLLTIWKRKLLSLVQVNDFLYLIIFLSSPLPTLLLHLAHISKLSTSVSILTYSVHLRTKQSKCERMHLTYY